MSAQSISYDAVAAVALEFPSDDKEDYICSLENIYNSVNEANSGISGIKSDFIGMVKAGNLTTARSALPHVVDFINYAEDTINQLKAAIKLLKLAERCM